MTPMLLDIGAGELLAIIVIAAILLGPEKVPPLAKKAGRVLGFLRKVANTATDQIKTELAELGPEFADLKITDLKPQNLLQRVIPLEAKSEIDSLKAELVSMQSRLELLQIETKNEVQTATAMEPISLLPTTPAAPTAPDQPSTPPIG